MCDNVENTGISGASDASAASSMPAVPHIGTGKRYTSERHTQILIALLKEHGVRKVVASPGATNLCLVGSLQSDPFFEIYSSVDERSAAYIACGLAAESGEPVALSCTGSTASRNYLPGLTEAYYRQLPVLAVTASQHLGRVGQYCSQVIDRSDPLADVVRESVTLDCVHTEEDAWACALAANKALLALRKDGGGPAHVNLVTTYSRDFSVRELPAVRPIRHASGMASAPSLEGYGRIAVLVGAHGRFSADLRLALEDFCRAYDAVVVASHASNYRGEFGYNPDLIGNMAGYTPRTERADLVIYIGSVSRYPSGMRGADMWRVNPDGEVRDPERCLTRVFAVEEADFFRHYADLRPGAPAASPEGGYARRWQAEYAEVLAKAPELPFCNVWVAQTLSRMLPPGCVFHLSGSNTARAWNFFPLPETVECYSNDGAMGIDGQVSALVGESLADPGRLHLGAAGDLTFFYDMNVLGNRHVGPNLRLMVVNNGVGAEFKIYSHPAAHFGDAADPYMAAAGHYGGGSRDLMRHYAEDLGYEYLCASTKAEFEEAARRFTTPEMTDRPMVLEVFTDADDESAGIYAMNHIVEDTGAAAKRAVRSIIGEKGVSAIKGVLGRR